jgi:hypothetical protein
LHLSWVYNCFHLQLGSFLFHCFMPLDFCLDVLTGFGCLVLESCKGHVTKCWVLFVAG